MPSFTPPTISYGAGQGDPLFDRYSTPVGVSVVKVDGVFVQRPFPWLGEIDGLTEGVEWFQGGRTYIISNEVAAELQSAGFETGA